MPHFLPESEIQEAAEELLLSFQKKYGSIQHYVPLDLIIEQHLGIHLEVFDNALLPTQFHDDVLGYIDLQTNSIGIHESILPENSGKEGRYHFTLGHEAGHFILHREEILASAAQFSCFEQEQPRYLAKNEKDNSSLEWQADSFSGHLIMPSSLVHRQWRDFTGNHRPLTLRMIADRFSEKPRREFKPEVLAEIYLKEMAKKLKVSQKALFIRLKKMGLIVEREQFFLPV
jgi:Zn-dependent peptidase ImmA (M78 family)